MSIRKIIEELDRNDKYVPISGGRLAGKFPELTKIPEDELPSGWKLGETRDHVITYERIEDNKRKETVRIRTDHPGTKYTIFLYDIGGSSYIETAGSTNIMKANKIALNYMQKYK